MDEAERIVDEFQREGWKKLVRLPPAVAIASLSKLTRGLPADALGYHIFPALRGRLPATRFAASG